jgi:NADH-quinone oxidoreductase subunit J
MQNFLFYLGGVLMVFCALRAVTTPYIFRAALYLAATLALTALQYVLLQAEFVAVVQILVYVGAVIILMIFAVMLTAQIGEGNIAQTNKYALPAALVTLALLAGFYKILTGYDWSKVPQASAAPTEGALSNIQAIGHAVVGPYVYPFEIIGLLLFSSLVGAVLIARKDPE